MLAFSVADLHSLDALIDLPEDARPRQAAAGAETAIVAEGASPLGDGPVDIGASEPGVHADLLNSQAELLAQEMIVGVVSKSRCPPAEMLLIRRKLVD